MKNGVEEYNRDIFSDDGSFVAYHYDHLYLYQTQVHVVETGTPYGQPTLFNYAVINVEETLSLNSMRVLDWHPDNEIILTSEVWHNYSNSSNGDVVSRLSFVQSNHRGS